MKFGIPSNLLPSQLDHSGEYDFIDHLLEEFLSVMGSVVAYDLATIMELSDQRLKVRAMLGPLASDRVRRHTLDLKKNPAMRRVLETGRGRSFGVHGPGEADPFDGVLDFPHGHSCMVVPLCLDDRPLGIMTFDRRIRGYYNPKTIQLAEVLGRLLAVTLAFGARTRELDRLVQLLEGENRLLHARTRAGVDSRDLLTVCPSEAMRSVTHLARQVAPTDSPVLITGETGTGKEVLAKAIHLWSVRAGRPMVSLNCAALSRELIESELFGHVKGAFTGAAADRQGRFKAADGGTLMLDEVGELPIELQAKLLRVLQEGQFESLGSSRTEHVNVRLIAATNIDLLQAVEERRFREDLYYRLAVFPIHLTPLRDRPEDLPIIARNILEDVTRGTGRETPVLTRAQITRLQQHDWPGNIRELVNTLRRALVLSTGTYLDLDMNHLNTNGYPGRINPARRETKPFQTLEAQEIEHIREALRRTNGKIYGDDGAAVMLGINPNTLRGRMRKYGLGGARDFRPAR
ncbi:MAG: sigma 54-interacting transcriptional regulator [Acidobacteriota bacterium]|nr:sigma 54-interacting transcriptional regulator [Acidobacteriota bacterium]